MSDPILALKMLEAATASVGLSESIADKMCKETDKAIAVLQDRGCLSRVLTRESRAMLDLGFLLGNIFVLTIKPRCISWEEAFIPEVKE